MTTLLKEHTSGEISVIMRVDADGTYTVDTTDEHTQRNIYHNYFYTRRCATEAYNRQVKKYPQEERTGETMTTENITTETTETETTETTTTESMTAYTITPNEQYKSLEITFESKPAESVREVLKGFRFRWNNKKGVWYGFADREALEKALQGETDETPATDSKPGKKQTGTAQNHIKIYWNGLKIDGGELTKVYYSINGENVCILADSYGGELPRDLFEVRNETDLYTDYFDKDSATVTPEHALYKYVLYNAQKAAAHYAEHSLKYYAKKGWKLDDLTAANRQKSIDTFKAATDPGQPTQEDLDAIDRQRQEAENKRREEEHEAELAERERVLNRRANGRRYIEQIAAEHPIKDGEPVVNIPFSEDPVFYSWTCSEARTMMIINQDGTKETKVLEPKRELWLSLQAAEIVLYHFDMDEPEGEGYCKTDFNIFENGEDVYKGRYDLGDRDGGLLHHIELIARWDLEHDHFGHVKGTPDETNERLQFVEHLRQYVA